MRVSVRAEFQDALGTQEFFAYRRRGIEPSEVPPVVTLRAVDVVLHATEEQLFTVSRLPDFTFTRPKNSFARVKCSRCQEYVFERYARTVEGNPVCIPCSGFGEPRLDVMKGLQ